MHSHRRFVLAALLALLPSGIALAQSPASTAFTYQGELSSAGTPATGLHDIRFRLFDAATGGSQIGSTLCSDNLTVVSGRFAASLDFGAVAFNGQKRFLEIEVREDSGLDCADPSGYTVLAPRQELTASPLASFALTAGLAATSNNALSLGGQPSSFFTNSANLTGTLPTAVLPSNVARTDANQTFTGQLTFSNPANNFSGNGSGLTNLSGSAISQGTIPRLALDSPTQLGLGTIIEEWSSLPIIALGAVTTGVRPAAVVVSDNYAYVPCFTSNQLQIIDISNLAAPFIASSVVMPTGPRSIALAGNYAYVTCATAGSLQVVDITNPNVAVQVLSVPTGIDPNGIVINGNLAYITCGGSNLVQIFDISNPASTSLVGSVPSAANPRAPKVSGSNLVVACSSAGALQVFSLSNPTSPTLLSTAPTLGSPLSLAVSGTTVFTTTAQSGGRLQIFSIANPAAPALLSTSITGPDPQAVAVTGNLVFVASSTAGLSVYDITNLSAPIQLTSQAAGNQPRGLAVVGNRAFVTDYSANALRIFAPPSRTTFSNPLAASALSNTDASGLVNVPAANLTGTVSDTRLSANIARLDASQTFTGQTTFSNPANSFTGNGAGLTNLSGSAITQGTISRSTLTSDAQSGLASSSPLEWALTPYELSTPAPGLSVPIAAVSWGNYLAGRSNNGGGTVRLYDITAPRSPVAGATLSGIGANSSSPSMVGTGSLFFIAAGAGVQIYDVSNINSPSLVRTLTAASTARVLVSGNTLIVAAGSSLQLYSLDDPANPTLLSTTATSGSIGAVAVLGSRLYLTIGSTDFAVYNIQNPSTPTLLGTLAISEGYGFLAVSGTTVYALRGITPATIDVISAANPSALSRTVTPTTVNFPVALIVSGNHLLASNGSGASLNTYNISDPLAPTLVTTTFVQSGYVTLGSSALYAVGSAGAIAVTPAPAARLTAPISGSGAALTNINALNITSGTLSTARLPASVARTDTANTFGNFINTFTGNVGIGTTTPSRPLSFGTTLTDKIALYDGTNDFWGFGITTGALQIKTGNNERMRVTNSGVSIGTSANPTKALEIFGAGNINGLRVRGDSNPSFSIGRGSTDEFEIGIASGVGNFSLSANAGDTILRTVAGTPGKIHLQGGQSNAALTIAGTQVGINTTNPTNALTVSGNMNVTGSLAKAGGSFLIDHPLDPENKYLYHSFVESPDMMNIYNGIITTDSRGYAIVELPDYFEALNRDFRYQLTAVDDSENDFILTKVYREIGVNAPRQFTIKSSVPNIKVSWQVTGIRQDAWAQKNRIPNSVDKPATEKGTLLHPEAFGKPSNTAPVHDSPTTATGASALPAAPSR